MTYAGWTIKEDGDQGVLLLLEEISHRVTNEYTSAIAAISLASAGLPDLASRVILNETASRLLAQANAHRALLPPNPLGLMDLGRYIADLCKRLEPAGVADRDLNLICVQSGVLVDDRRCWLVGLITAELINNAVRHAKLRPGDTVTVEIAEQGPNVVCIVRDDGRQPLTPNIGTGRRLIERLATQLEGEVTWSLGGGSSHVRLEFPRKPFRPMGAVN